MSGLKFLIFLVAVVNVAIADLSVVEVAQDMYKSCLQDFSVRCVRPKALGWINQVSDKRTIRITDDLVIVRNENQDVVVQRDHQDDNILDRFDNFLLGHDVIAKVPSVLGPDGPFGSLVPRSIQPDPIQVPLSATGRSSKIVKKVIFPFLLGLKFKTAVLVPLALGLIALTTWKALTLGLISLVLTGAVAIFSKFAKPPTYEVVHYPQIDAHHIDVAPQLYQTIPAPLPVAAPFPVYGPVYRNKRDAAKIAYSEQRK